MLNGWYQVLLNLSIPGHVSPLMVRWHSAQNRWGHWPDWKTVVEDSLELQREQERREVKVSVMTEMELVKSYWSRLTAWFLAACSCLETNISFSSCSLTCCCSPALKAASMTAFSLSRRALATSFLRLSSSFSLVVETKERLGTWFLEALTIS